MSIATSHTRVEMDALRVISAFSVRIVGIVVANNSGAVREVEFVDADGVAVLTVAIAEDTTEVIDIEWLAENGLTVSTVGQAGVTVTVFHGGTGA